MKDYLFVDGYNVINAWKELQTLCEDDLGHARDLLVSWVSEYAAFRGLQATVVYDATSVPGEGSRLRLQGIDVIYTDGGETADARIEALVQSLRHCQEKVFVVTGDYAEQKVVFGSGAYRLSSREFHEEFLKTKREIAEESHRPKRWQNRRELDSRLDGEVLQRLEDLRRDR